MLTHPTSKSLREALDRSGPGLGVLLDAAEQAARAVGADLWAVGGVVRDIALQRPVNDLDLALRGPLDAFLTALGTRIEVEPTEGKQAERFGTASIRLGEARLDLARLRSEHYVTPGALPEVSPTASLEVDLKRRDYTVNAMALGLVGPDAGHLVDPFDGMGDLRTRTLRVLHERSFEDDATRLWRGARTAALFDLTPDPATLRLIEDGGRWLDSISGERITAELRFTARRRRLRRAVDLLDTWGVLRATHPAWRVSEATRAALTRRGPVPLPRFLAVLLAPLAERTAILDRLNASKELRATVEDTARLLASAGAAGDLDALIRLEGTGEDARVTARWLAPELESTLLRPLRRWERTAPHLAAETVLGLGIPRGPVLGWTLARLRRGRYLGTLVTAADAKRDVRRSIEERGGDDPVARLGQRETN